MIVNLLWLARSVQPCPMFQAEADNHACILLFSWPHYTFLFQYKPAYKSKESCTLPLKLVSVLHLWSTFNTVEYSLSDKKMVWTWCLWSRQLILSVIPLTYSKKAFLFSTCSDITVGHQYVFGAPYFSWWVILWMKICI